MSCDVTMDYRDEEPCGQCRGCRRDAEGTETASLLERIAALEAEIARRDRAIDDLIIRKTFAPCSFANGQKMVARVYYDELTALRWPAVHAPKGPHTTS